MSSPEFPSNKESTGINRNISNLLSEFNKSEGEELINDSKQAFRAFLARLGPFNIKKYPTILKVAGDEAGFIEGLVDLLTQVKDEYLDKYSYEGMKYELFFSVIFHYKILFSMPSPREQFEALFLEKYGLQFASVNERNAIYPIRTGSFEVAIKKDGSCKLTAARL